MKTDIQRHMESFEVGQQAFLRGTSCVVTYNNSEEWDNNSDFAPALEIEVWYKDKQGVFHKLSLSPREAFLLLTHTGASL